MFYLVSKSGSTILGQDSSFLLKQIPPHILLLQKMETQKEMLVNWECCAMARRILAWWSNVYRVVMEQWLQRSFDTISRTFQVQWRTIATVQLRQSLTEVSSVDGIYNSVVAELILGTWTAPKKWIKVVRESRKKLKSCWIECKSSITASRHIEECCGVL